MWYNKIKRIGVLNLKTKLLLALLLITVVTLLTACSEEIEVYSKELIFLEKTTEESYNYAAIFESVEDEKYYILNLDNYTYDNLDFKTGDKLKFDAKPIQNRTIFDFAEEEILIFEEWREIVPLHEYLKKR